MGASARGLVELTRPVNSVAAGALTFVGGYVGGGARAEPAMLALAVVATVFAVAGGNAINDYFDRDVDRINDPERPIPRGAVTPRDALAFSGVLFALAVGAVLVLPWPALVIAVVNLLALLAYTELFKGLPGVGNAVVAYLGGSTFLFGAAAVGRLGTAAWVLFALATLSTFGRELVKDVEDLAGDEAEGLRTLPVVAGERTTLAVAAVAIGVAVLASPLPYLVGAFGAAYLAVVVPADGVMLYAAVRSFADAGAAQRVVKYGMFLATLAFVAGRLAVGS
ncbi:MAG: geranylgeranylglycerol-phosphate geranylgeranyltransferase [Halobacteriaceae archaeon]